jgi:hypothetical protein
MITLDKVSKRVCFVWVFNKNLKSRCEYIIKSQKLITFKSFTAVPLKYTFYSYKIAGDRQKITNPKAKSDSLKTKAHAKILESKRI